MRTPDPQLPWLAELPVRRVSPFELRRARLVQEVLDLHRSQELRAADLTSWIEELEGARSTADLAASVEARADVLGALNYSLVPRELAALRAVPGTEPPALPRIDSLSTAPYSDRFARLDPAARAQVEQLRRTHGPQLAAPLAFDVAAHAMMVRRWELQRHRQEDLADAASFATASASHLPWLFTKRAPDGGWDASIDALHDRADWTSPDNVWSILLRADLSTAGPDQLLLVYGKALAYAEVDPYARVLAARLPWQYAQTLRPRADAPAALAELVAAVRREATGAEPGWQSAEPASRRLEAGGPTPLETIAARAAHHWIHCRIAARPDQFETGGPLLGSGWSSYAWMSLNDNAWAVERLNDAWLHVDGLFLAQQRPDVLTRLYGEGRALLCSALPDVRVPGAVLLQEHLAGHLDAVDPALRPRIDALVDRTALAMFRLPPDAALRRFTELKNAAQFQWSVDYVLSPLQNERGSHAESVARAEQQTRALLAERRAAGVWSRLLPRRPATDVMAQQRSAVAGRTERPR